MFIVFEGLDLSGKSTLIQDLAVKLKELGYTVALHREPSDTVKQVLTQYTNKEIQYRAILNDRKAHQEELKKDIEKYDFVLCDRYITSTFVYQGLGVDEDIIREDNKDFIQPDLEIVLKTSYEEYKRRCSTRVLDRMDRYSSKEFKRMNWRYQTYTNGYVMENLNANDIIFAIFYKKVIDR